MKIILEIVKCFLIIVYSLCVAMVILFLAMLLDGCGEYESPCVRIVNCDGVSVECATEAECEEIASTCEQSAMGWTSTCEVTQ